MKFVIGTINGKKFLADSSIMADTRALITASSGAGKSYLLRGVVESVSSSIQTIVIDPEGEFHTLREKLDILVVGENGDLQVSIDSAGLLARKLAETGVSAVIDIYDLAGEGEPWDKRRQFVANFLNALMELPKSLRHPMLIIVDEAHQFAPEKNISEESGASRSAINSLMSAGRKRGLGGILATQRISKINKDSIADARNVFIGGTNLDIDQERAGDMLGMKKGESVTLRDLEPGQFYCFGPAFSGRGIFKFDSAPVKTTHPKAGQRTEIEVPKASTHVSKIVEQFGDLPKAAKQEKEDISLLRHENRRLQQELQARPVQVQPEKVIEKVEVNVVSDDSLSAIDDIIQSLIGEKNDLKEVRKSIDSTFDVTTQKLEQQINKLIQEISLAKQKSPWIGVDKGGKDFQAIQKIPNTKQSPAQIVVDGALSGPEQKILNALGWFVSIGHLSPKQVAVAFLAGYTYGGGAFNNPRGSLRTKGLVEYKGDCISLTVEGGKFAEISPIPLTVEELQSHVLAVLPGPETNILRELLAMYPNQISKEDLSARVGKRGGAFNNPLGRLRSLGLIEYPQPGYVVALSFLFME